MTRITPPEKYIRNHIYISLNIQACHSTYQRRQALKQKIYFLEPIYFSIVHAQNSLYPRCPEKSLSLPDAPNGRILNPGRVCLSDSPVDRPKSVLTVDDHTNHVYVKITIFTNRVI